MGELMSSIEEGQKEMPSLPGDLWELPLSDITCINEILGEAIKRVLPEYYPASAVEAFNSAV